MIWLVASVFAGTLVVTDGPLAPPIQEDLSAVPAVRVLTLPLQMAPIADGAQWLPCQAPPVDNAWLVGQIQHALTTENTEGPVVAQAQVGLALLSIRCLSEPLVAKHGAALLQLHGQLAYVTGDLTAADEAFGMALSLYPDATWNTDFPATYGQDRWATLQAEARRAVPGRLRVLPQTTTVTVDGQPVGEASMQVTPGWHFVQSAGGALWVEVPSGREVEVLLPAELDAAALAQVDDPLSGQATTSLLRALTTPGEALWVVSGERVLQYGSTGWEAKQVTTTDTMTDTISTSKLRTISGVVLATGAALLATDLTVQGVLVGQCKADESVCADGKNKFDIAYWLAVPAYTITGVGAAGLTTGLLLPAVNARFTW